MGFEKTGRVGLGDNAQPEPDDTASDDTSQSSEQED